MHIPNWIIATIVWCILGALGIGIISLCVWGAARAAWKTIKAWEQLMAAVGILAAFTNYLKTILHAANGGKDWVDDFLHPSDPDWLHRRDKRSYRLKNPSLYFAVKPHPEAWRWWMRYFGVKKPVVEG